MNTRLVQLRKDGVRAVALVDEPKLRVLSGVPSVLALTQEAVDTGGNLVGLARQKATGETFDYEPIYRGEGEWRLLVPVDHPEPARCLVSGTGLTHLGSAKNRSAMHEATESELTDSMKMFRWGMAGGKPAPGKTGVAPEWFFKGVGTILRAHGEPLDVPFFAEDGGEEAELAGVYLIDSGGQPLRVGMTTGNEFADHKFEKKNYLNLAGSKIRACSLGPEIVIDPEFQSVAGHASVERGGQPFWSKEIRTGEAEMCHSLANIEHHHFKFETHRRPGDLHVHYFGAHSLSFGDSVQLIDGDMMAIRFDGFGRALRNPCRIHRRSTDPTLVRSLA